MLFLSFETTSLSSRVNTKNYRRPRPFFYAKRYTMRSSWRLQKKGIRTREQTPQSWTTTIGEEKSLFSCPEEKESEQIWLCFAGGKLLSQLRQLPTVNPQLLLPSLSCCFPHTCTVVRPASVSTLAKNPTKSEHELELFRACQKVGQSSRVLEISRMTGRKDPQAPKWENGGS